MSECSIGAEEPHVKSKRKIRPRCKTCGRQHYGNYTECVDYRNYSMGTYPNYIFLYPTIPTPIMSECSICGRQNSPFYCDQCLPKMKRCKRCNSPTPRLDSGLCKDCHLPALVDVA